MKIMIVSILFALLACPIGAMDRDGSSRFIRHNEESEELSVFDKFANIKNWGNGHQLREFFEDNSEFFNQMHFCEDQVFTYIENAFEAAKDDIAYTILVYWNYKDIEVSCDVCGYCYPLKLAGLIDYVEKYKKICGFERARESLDMAFAKFKHLMQKGNGRELQEFLENDREFVKKLYILNIGNEEIYGYVEDAFYGERYEVAYTLILYWNKENVEMSRYICAKNFSFALDAFNDYLEQHGFEKAQKYLREKKYVGLNLGESNLKFFSCALMHNKDIEVLQILWLKPVSKLAKNIIDVVATLPNLKVLKICNIVSNRNARALAALLRTNKELIRLEIKGWKSDKGKKVLLDALNDNTTLMRIRIRNALYDSQWQRCVEPIILRNNSMPHILMMIIMFQENGVIKEIGNEIISMYVALICDDLKDYEMRIYPWVLREEKLKDLLPRKENTFDW